MSILSEALMWDGVSAHISMFSGVPKNIKFEYTSDHNSNLSKKISQFKLYDEDNLIKGLDIYVIDIYLRRIPDNLYSTLYGYAKDSKKSGSKFSWFFFDGGFLYEEFLSGDSYDNIYAIYSPSLGFLACLNDEERSSIYWKNIMSSFLNEILTK